MATFSQLWRRKTLISRKALAIALLGFSAVATLFTMGALIRFDQTLGSVGATPKLWPPASSVRRQAGRPELLVFTHPFCSCTDATIAELSLLSRNNSRLASPEITILFFRPRNSGWAQNRLWQSAAALENSHVFWDEGGEEAKRFGARTSGYVVFYNSGGELLFRGGVTGSRGHQGDNYGFNRLASSLNSLRPSTGRSQVFGCALFGSDEQMVGEL